MVIRLCLQTTRCYSSVASSVFRNLAMWLPQYTMARTLHRSFLLRPLEVRVVAWLIYFLPLPILSSLAVGPIRYQFYGYIHIANVFQGHHHSKGIAVLVALCAALGSLFLIILVGIILDRMQRRRNGYNTIPIIAYTDKHPNLYRVPPEHLFGTLAQRNGNGVGAPRV